MLKSILVSLYLVLLTVRRTGTLDEIGTGIRCARMSIALSELHVCIRGAFIRCARMGIALSALHVCLRGSQNRKSHRQL